MEMEPPTAAQATAASNQALAEALQANGPASAPSHCLVLSTFWKEDPVEWLPTSLAEILGGGM